MLGVRSTEWERGRERVQGSVWCTKLKLLDILSHHEYYTSVIVRSGQLFIDILSNNRFEIYSSYIMFSLR